MKDEYAFNYILNDATKSTFEGYEISCIINTIRKISTKLTHFDHNQQV